MTRARGREDAELPKVYVGFYRASATESYMGRGGMNDFRKGW